MKIKENNKIYFLIFISLIVSSILSVYYISSYDDYNLDGITHIMLKEETFAHWFNAAKIIEQIKSGVSFYEAGEEVFTKPLPQRLVALYAYITNFQIIENWDTLKINQGGKLAFLITQSILYYIAIYLFYRQISKYFSSNIVFFIIAFLCLEPTIFQYHSSFWTESFYFSIQLFILTLMLDGKEKKINFIIIGLLLGILFIQRSTGIFYFFIIIIYYFFTLRKDKYLKILLLILFYLVICIGLGLHNYKRVGLFYVMPTEGKYGLYKYLSKDVLIQAQNSSMEEVNKAEVEKSFLWIKENQIHIDYLEWKKIDSPYEIGLEIKNEKDRLKFYSYLSKRAYEILLENPLITLKKVINGYLHFSVLNPFFIYYDYEYFKHYSSDYIGDFVYSTEHKKLIPIRIIYSLIIYIFVFFGLISCFKKNPKLCFLLLGSIFYYYLICGWYGKTRLFVPILIYCSVFFGNGIDYLKIYFRKIIKLN